jgi:hypothetical protein
MLIVTLCIIIVIKHNVRPKLPLPQAKQTPRSLPLKKGDRPPLTIDNLRELLKGALEANLLLASVQQNDVTKKLAAWAAILVPTAIAGVYGMNFKYMPELEHPEAYPIVLVAIAALCSYLYYRFKRSGWL